VIPHEGVLVKISYGTVHLVAAWNRAHSAIVEHAAVPDTATVTFPGWAHVMVVTDPVALVIIIVSISGT